MAEDKNRRVQRLAAGAVTLCALLVVAAQVGSREGEPRSTVLAVDLRDVVDKLVLADHVLRREDLSYAAILRQRSRLRAVKHPGESNLADRQELAMRPHEGLHEMVMMLAAEVQRPGVCAKRELIMEKLEALLKRLGARAVTVNATDNQYRTAAETSLTVWLEVETLYRMSEEKYDETKEASGFVMHELEVAKRVEQLTQKDVKKVIAEYPGKKQEVNEEKELVLELIDMVQEIKFSDEPSAKAAPAQLQYIHSEVSSIAGRPKPLKLRDEFARLRHIKSQLSRMGRGTGADSTLRQQTLADENGVMRLTKEDVEVTKAAVIKILMSLLKEPDFREHLLDMGLKAAKARLEKDRKKVLDLEGKEVELANQMDKADHEVHTSELERNKAAGDKVASEEAFVSEHKDYLSQTSSNEKGVFIIQTIIQKINDFCDKQASGTAPAEAASPGGGAAAEAAIQPLLAAAQAAAEAAWRSGGDRR